MKKENPMHLRLSPQTKLEEEKTNLYHLWRKLNPRAKLLRRIRFWILLFTGCLITAFLIDSAKAGTWQDLNFFVGAFVVGFICFTAVTVTYRLYWNNWYERHPLDLKHPWVHPDPKEL